VLGAARDDELAGAQRIVDKEATFREVREKVSGQFDSM
jgi:hypothetical protein